MEFIKCISKNQLLILFFLFLFFFQGEAQKPKKDNYNIMGDWRYIKHYAWRATQFGDKEINAIKSSILHIDNSKVGFEGPASKIIEPCTYGMKENRKFFDRLEKEPNFVEDRAMAIIYTKEQLREIKRIELNCNDNCLSILYLKQDTLILNYCGGYTFLMIKSIDRLVR